MPTIWFVDTSVFCELIEVPMMCDRADELRRLLAERIDLGDRFVVPVTTVIETGNHICNVQGQGRREAAERFASVVRSAASGDPLWVLGVAGWDAELVGSIIDGAGTGVPFIDHAAQRGLGTGDLAIVAERDAFRSTTPYRDVRIWTLDQRLAAHG